MTSKPTHPALPGTSRRAAVQAGAVGLLGLGMNHLNWLHAAGGAGGRERAKSVIYIFLSGGLAQHESFDLKPDAPSDIRGEFKPIPTRTPGLHICEHLPELAKSNDHSAGHHIMLTGRSDIPPGFNPSLPKDSDWPSIAALTGARFAPKNNLPPAIILPEKLVHRTGRVIPGQFAGIAGKRREPWFLDCAPYNAANYGAYPEYLFHHREGPKEQPLYFRAPNLSLPEWLSGGRLRDRLSLSKELTGQRAQLASAGEAGGHDRYWEMATTLLTDGQIADAFDVTNAPLKEQERYGRNSFGWSLLLASRLVQRGVRLVQVNLGNNETWDTHESAFPNLKNFLLPPTDRAVSALLDDLRERGLLDSTLIVMAGEFGRTPRIFSIPGARLPGRDHWGAVQTVFFAGGGVRGGTVIGSSDKTGGYPASSPQTPENLAATIYDALGIPQDAHWLDEQGRPQLFYHGTPIPGLIT
jgi:hypothetical protein